jgi:hypothetical protein
MGTDILDRDVDQVFILCQPVRRIHEQIAVAILLDELVRREVGVTVNNHPRLGRCVLRAYTHPYGAG